MAKATFVRLCARVVAVDPELWPMATTLRGARGRLTAFARPTRGAGRSTVSPPS